MMLTYAICESLWHSTNPTWSIMTFHACVRSAFVSIMSTSQMPWEWQREYVLCEGSRAHPMTRDRQPDDASTHYLRGFVAPDDASTRYFRVFVAPGDASICYLREFVTQATADPQPPFKIVDVGPQGGGWGLGRVG